MGKSTLGIDFARAAALHHNMTSVVFSLEMSKVELAQRIISAETNIPMAAPAPRRRHHPPNAGTP